MRIRAPHAIGCGSATALDVPLFLYRELFDSATRWMAGQARLDRTDAFYWENRTRYIFSYIRERHREHA